MGNKLRYTLTRAARAVRAPVEPGAAPAPPERIPLSSFDSFIFVRGLSASCAFFYPSSPNVEAIETSLAHTLKSFPILAGRIAPASTRPAGAPPPPVPSEFDVVCTNAGALLDEYACSGSLSHFDAYPDCTNNNEPPPFVPTMRPERCFTHAGPVLLARITRLSDGWILGVTLSHALVDGASSLLFMDAWSRACVARARGDGAAMPAPRVPIVFDRAALLKAALAKPRLEVADGDAEGAAQLAAAHAAVGAERDAVARLVGRITLPRLVGRVAKLGFDHLVRRCAHYTVRVSADQVKAARARAAAAGTPCSANDVLLGIAWALLRECRARGPGAQPRLVAKGAPPAQFMFQGASKRAAIDLRRQLPLAATYFGNASWVVRPTAPVGETRPLALAAASRAAMDLFVSTGAVYDSALAMVQPGSGGGTLGMAALPIFSDGMLSSWVAPHMWGFEFGSGPPVWQWSGIAPTAPWGFAIMAGRPDTARPGGAGPDLVLCGSCPASRLKRVMAAAGRIVADACGEAAAPTVAPSPAPAEAA